MVEILINLGGFSMKKQEAVAILNSLDIFEWDIELGMQNAIYGKSYYDVKDIALNFEARFYDGEFFLEKLPSYVYFFKPLLTEIILLLVLQVKGKRFI